MLKKGIIGIDLAGISRNPSGVAVWLDKKVQTSLLYTDNQILESVLRNKPEIIAIDAPLCVPKQGTLRKADREMMKKGYRVFPPSFKAMKTLTTRAVKLNRLISEKGFETIEVHPTSTCKALSVPLKEYGKIQAILEQIGLNGDHRVCTLASHEIDAVIAALTAYLYCIGETDAFGDEDEGYIIVPKKQDWRTLTI